jgi:hypothetical protein
MGRSSKLKKNSSVVLGDVIGLLVESQGKNKNEKVGTAIEMLRNLQEQMQA